MITTNLLNLRKAEGLTQKALAKRLNVSDKTISHWETGISQPSFSQLKELKDIFLVSYEDLLD